MIIALIMAGGEGTRLGAHVEKPLITIKGRPMIDFVIQALQGAKRVDDILVATSPHTPNTEKYVNERGIKTIKSPGKGYVADLEYIITKLPPNIVLLTITADLPLIKSSTLDQVLEEYEKSDKPAMCVALHPEIFRRYNLVPSMEIEGVIPSGLNILRSINKQQEEEVLILNEIELALNVNSPEDIIFLEEHLKNSG